MRLQVDQESNIERRTVASQVYINVYVMSVYMYVITMPCKLFKSSRCCYQLINDVSLDKEPIYQPCVQILRYE